MLRKTPNSTKRFFKQWKQRQRIPRWIVRKQKRKLYEIQKHLTRKYVPLSQKKQLLLNYNKPNYNLLAQWLFKAAISRKLVHDKVSKRNQLKEMRWRSRQKRYRYRVMWNNKRKARFKIPTLLYKTYTLNKQIWLRNLWRKGVARAKFKSTKIPGKFKSRWYQALKTLDAFTKYKRNLGPQPKRRWKRIDKPIYLKLRAFNKWTANRKWFARKKNIFMLQTLPKIFRRLHGRVLKDIRTELISTPTNSTSLYNLSFKYLEKMNTNYTSMSKMLRKKKYTVISRRMWKISKYWVMNKKYKKFRKQNKKHDIYLLRSIHRIGRGKYLKAKPIITIPLRNKKLTATLTTLKWRLYLENFFSILRTKYLKLKQRWKKSRKAKVMSQKRGKIKIPRHYTKLSPSLNFFVNKRKFISRRFMSQNHFVQRTHQMPKSWKYYLINHVKNLLKFNKRNFGAAPLASTYSFRKFNVLYKTMYLHQKLHEKIKLKTHPLYKYFKQERQNTWMLGQWRQNNIFPWLQPFLVKRLNYSMQFSKMLRRSRGWYPTKRNKIYRTFNYLMNNRYQKIKLKVNTGGGNPTIQFKFNLLKVILPFYGKLNVKQFKQIWKQFNRIKSSQSGRTSKVATKLNTTIYTMIQQLNWVPNTWWAMNMIKNGWIYVSNSQKRRNLKTQISTNQLFPLYNSVKPNIKYKIVDDHNTNPFRQLNLNDIIQINPKFKLFSRKFFNRKHKWRSKSLPSNMEINSNLTTAVMVAPFQLNSLNHKSRVRKVYLRYLTQ